MSNLEKTINDQVSDLVDRHEQYFTMKHGMQGNPMSSDQAIESIHELIEQVRRADKEELKNLVFEAIGHNEQLEIDRSSRDELERDPDDCRICDGTKADAIKRGCSFHYAWFMMRERVKEPEDLDV